MLEELMSLEGWLLGLQGPGLAAAVGVALSFLIDIWKGYADLSSVAKRLVFAGLCVAIPALAMLAGIGLGYQEFSIELVWAILVAACAAMSTGTLTHTRKL